MRISDWSSDVCSSDLDATDVVAARYPGIEFVKAPYLNDHEQVLRTFEARIQEILEGSGNMNCQMCKYREQVLGFEAEIGQIGRAACRERVCQYVEISVVAGSLKKKKKT